MYLKVFTNKYLYSLFISIKLEIKLLSSYANCQNLTVLRHSNILEG